MKEISDCWAMITNGSSWRTTGRYDILHQDSFPKETQNPKKWTVLVLHRISRFVALPWHKKMMGIEAVLMLATARMLIFCLPFSLWNGLLRIDRHGTATDTTKMADLTYHPKARRIGSIVNMVAHHVPFKAVCLPQAMAAQWMLSRRDIASLIVIGAHRTQKDNSLDFHAWLVSEDIIVTGKHEHERFSTFIKGKPPKDDTQRTKSASNGNS